MLLSRRTFVGLLPAATILPNPFTNKIMWNGVFLEEKRLRKIQQCVRAKEQPTWEAFQQLQQDAVLALQRKSIVPTVWYVPGFYIDPEGHRKAKNGLAADANAAYGLALMYRITREKKYADHATYLIDAWVQGIESMSQKDDSMLSFSYHFPAMTLAASLLQGKEVWSESGRTAFRYFLQTKALPMNTMDHPNNWGNWGMVLVITSAAYLQDADLFQSAINRWKSFIETQIAVDGHLPQEVGRNNGVGEHGLWYSHFCLMPQTIAAEVAAINGIALYDYRSPSGHTLQSAFECLIPWVASPTSFPYYKGTDPNGQFTTDYISYWEVLNTHWPNSSAQALLQAHRPLTAQHTAPYLTLTHGIPY